VNGAFSVNSPHKKDLKSPYADQEGLIGVHYDVNGATPWFPVERDNKRYDILFELFTKYIF
jgi:hypothetical protein